tara:strand:+ start:6594 stop:7016 length:423 start_codon:yes stop_codon:yes gene_type:complete
MLETQKSKITRITPLDGFNDLFKFEIEFENGHKGKMYKKKPETPHAVGDLLEYTLNEKGTIKIAYDGPVGSEQSDPSKNNVIMLQCMYKAAASFYAHRSSISETQVAETAQLWFDKATAQLKGNSKDQNKTFKTSDDAPF